MINRIIAVIRFIEEKILNDYCFKNEEYKFNLLDIVRLNFKSYSEEKCNKWYKFLNNKNTFTHAYYVISSIIQKMFYIDENKIYYYTNYSFEYKLLIDYFGIDFIKTILLIKCGFDDCKDFYKFSIIFPSDNFFYHDKAENHFHLKGSADFARFALIEMTNRLCNLENNRIIKIIYCIRYFIYKESICPKNNVDIEIKNILKSDFELDNQYSNAIFTKIEALKGNSFDYVLSLLPNKNDLHYYDGEFALLFNYLKNVGTNTEKLYELFFVYCLSKYGFLKLFVQLKGKSGLLTFKEYNNNKNHYLKKCKEELIADTIKNIELQNDIKKIEYRITPQNINESMGSIKKYSKIDNYGLIVHFIKDNSNDLHKKLNVNMKDIVNFIEGNPKNKIVGIDAANIEIGCRAYQFSYYYDFIREKYPNMRFTYHVGEEFNGLLDGLRAIYESIIYLNISDGDRLGHCIALGINPEIYLCKNPEIQIKAIDLLDNYIFAYYILRKIKYEPLERLTAVIYNLYYRIFNEKLRNIDDYIESWKQRGLISYEKNMAEKETFNKDALRIHKKYFYNEAIQKNGNNIITINELKDIEIICEIQKELINMIKNMGICIEVNPTSNFLIGPYDSIYDSPFKKFYAPNKKEIPICICTDDKGIFNTNLLLEYSIVYNTFDKAIRKDMREYIKQLSEDSIKYSFVK